MNINQHKIKEIKISKITELQKGNGEYFYTKDFIFLNEDNEKITFKCFSDNKKSLKSKN